MNLYFAETPYHVLLSISHARASDRESMLFVRSESEGMGDLLDSLRYAAASPFVEIRHLSNGMNDSVETRKLKRYAASVKTLIASRRESFTTAYFFNDRFLANQFLMYSLERSGIGIEFIEDGSAAYSAGIYSPKHEPPSFVPKRVLFGPWWRSVDVLGTSGYSHDLWVTHPKYVRPELETLTHHKLPARFDDNDSGWVSEFFEQVGFDHTASFDTVVMVPHSSIIRDPDRVKRHVAETLERQGTSFDRAAFKYHPREPDFDYLGVSTDGRVVIPRSIPAELLYLDDGRISTLVGGSTTSLLTANWLLDDVDIVFSPFEDNNKDRFGSILVDIGAVSISKDR